MESAFWFVLKTMGWMALAAMIFSLLICACLCLATARMGKHRDEDGHWND